MSKRIIGSLILKGGHVVQSIGFSKYLPVGSPEVAVEFLNSWGVDEIVVLEIEGSIDVELVRRLAKKSYVPLAVGGGIRDIDHMRQLIAGGADKLVINTIAKQDSDFITKAAAIFGDQCIVVSIDVHEGEAGVTEAITRAIEATKSGAGEILLRCIERDGSKKGFDLLLTQAVASAISVPVIAAGGYGSATHAKDAFSAGAEAVAIGNMLHFSEHSVITIKQQLKAMGVPVRLDTYATYEGFEFDELGRPKKLDDARLQKLRFEYHPPETI